MGFLVLFSRPPLRLPAAAAVTSDADVILVKVCSAEGEQKRREHSALWDSNTIHNTPEQSS